MLLLLWGIFIFCFLSTHRGFRPALNDFSNVCVFLTADFRIAGELQEVAVKKFLDQDFSGAALDEFKREVSSNFFFIYFL